MTGFGDPGRTQKGKVTNTELQELLNEALREHQSGNLEKAECSYASLIRNGLKSEVAFSNLGVIYKNTNRPLEAMKCFKQAILSNPCFSEAYVNLGTLYSEQGDIEEAISHTKKAIELNSLSAVAYGNMGAFLRQKNELDMALAAIVECLRLNPENATGQLNLGLVFLSKEQPEKALPAIRKAVSLMPNHAASHLALGSVYKNLGQLDKAVRCTNIAITLDPTASDAYSNLSILWHMQGELDKAKDSAAEAIVLNPNSTMAYRSLGAICRDRGELDEAVIAAKKAVELDPRDVIAYMNLGSIHAEQCKFMEAEYYTQKAIEIKPDFSAALFNLSQYQLIRHEYAQGWHNYGFREPSIVANNSYTNQIRKSHKWQGDKGQRVYVVGDQGIGDQILFASMLEEMQHLCTHITLGIDRRLGRIFNRSFKGNINIVSINERPLSCDFYITLGDLGKYFRQSLSDFRNQPLQYLIPDQDRSRGMRNALSKRLDKKIYGLSWRSYGPRFYNRKKCIPLGIICSRLKGLDAEYVSLQYGDCRGEIGSVRSELNFTITEVPGLNATNDIDGLASLIYACDAVITISNVTAHLAGALGVETHLLVPASPHFYWGLECQWTPWYPSVRIYRQCPNGSWEKALKQLVAALSKEG